MTELDPVPLSSTAFQRSCSAVLLGVYRRLEGKIECERDAFELSDAASLLTGIPEIEIGNAASASDEDDIQQALSALEAYSLDVILALGQHHVARSLAPAAVYGAWFLRHAHCRAGDAAAAGFWPVYGLWPTVESQLEAIGPRELGPRVVDRSFSAINPYSVKLSRSALYWKTCALLTRGLAALHRFGPTYLQRPMSTGDAPRERPLLGPPTRAQLAHHIARNIGRRAAHFATRHFKRDGWFLLFHLGEDLSTRVGDFTKIIPPADRYWADPHVLRRNGRFYVFIEEYIYSTGKGHLSVLEIDEHGRHSKPTTVLERNYHLSYPFVFEHADDIYMVPESSAKGTVDLYRCVEFPLRWELVRTLMMGVKAVDSTLLHHEGRWWLFANLAETEGASTGEELFLFHADALLEGSFEPHRANPVVSDVRGSRPAGPVLRRDGRLYRPAQDCSVRYGYGITLNEIETLSPESYAETPTQRILPTWDKTVIAAHTLSYVPGITLMDAQQPYLKYLSPS